MGNKNDAKASNVAAAPSGEAPKGKDAAAKGGKNAKTSKAERRAAKVAQRNAGDESRHGKDNANSSSGNAFQGGMNGSMEGSNGLSGAHGGANTANALSNHNSSDNSNTASWIKQQQQLFFHLDGPSTSQSLAKSIKQSQASIAPSIARLAIQYAEFSVRGANVRCIAMLEAFKEVIKSYQTPPQATLARHLPSYLSPQISHLVQARPLSVSMGNAIRYVKSEIGNLPPEWPDEKSKHYLIKRIDAFIHERIVLANEIIQQHGINKVKDGDCIMTYGESVTVQQICIEAYRRGKRFRVIVVDSAPLYEAREMFETLTKAGIPSTYVLLPHITLLLPEVTLCLIAARALLSNGAVFARAGTAMVAMTLKKRGCPVVCCCETYKFTERVMLDSIVGNEITSLSVEDESADSAHMTALNLLYDVSRPEDLTAFITEAGIIAVEAVPVVLRDYKPLIQGAAAL